MLRKRIEQSDFFQRHRYRLMAANELVSAVSALLLILFLAADQSAQARSMRHMISEIQTSALLTGLHTGLYRIDGKVLDAVAQVPRDRFVGVRLAPYAYENVALPMAGRRHVIPEPFLSAMMVHLLDIRPGNRVLDIGFGVGYETAIIANLARSVYAIEQKAPFDKPLLPVNPLAAYDNIQIRSGNGLYGWPEAGPFDAILIRQAIAAPPPPLLRQLRVGGRLVVPLVIDGEPQQRLTVFTKMPDGTFSARQTLFLKTTALFPGREA